MIRFETEKEVRLNGERRLNGEMERKNKIVTDIYIYTCNRKKYRNIRPSEVGYIKKKYFKYLIRNMVSVLPRAEPQKTQFQFKSLFIDVSHINLRH